MNGRIGQGSMEYLMTYGWAIVVVMVVGVAMWQLGIFNRGTTLLTATGFAKIKPQLAGTGIARDGTFKATFTNAAGGRITLVNVRLYDEKGNLMCCAAANAPAACNGIDGGFSVGGGPGATGYGTWHVVAGDNFGVGITGGTGTCIGSSTDDAYRVKVEVEYKTKVGDHTLTHIDVGTLRGPYE